MDVLDCASKLSQLEDNIQALDFEGMIHGGVKVGDKPVGYQSNILSNILIESGGAGVS
ncbi:MAG: hypothetical protein IGS39_27005 [Calothrix sp. C42_A2020_038]|nr:hypothetical protein [Calothrix sp. C42_A2020_038]